MIEEILAYQSADAKLREIEKTLGANEDRKKAVIAKKYLETVEESITKLDTRASRLVIELEQMAIEQAKLIEQEEEFKHSVDIANDQTEIAFLLKKIDEVSAKIKALMKQAETLNSNFNAVSRDYAKLKSDTKAMQAQYKTSGMKYNEFKATFNDERENIDKELTELGKKVDANLLERYKVKRKGKIFPVVYEVRGNVCGACNMELPMSDLNKLKNGEIIDCEQCGRLLYQSKK